jgi:hypothetical protein
LATFAASTLVMAIGASDSVATPNTSNGSIGFRDEHV